MAGVSQERDYFGTKGNFSRDSVYGTANLENEDEVF